MREAEPNPFIISCPRTIDSSLEIVVARCSFYVIASHYSLLRMRAAPFASAESPLHGVRKRTHSPFQSPYKSRWSLRRTFRPEVLRSERSSYCFVSARTFFLPGSTGLRSSRADVLRDIGCGDDQLGLADRVVGNEHDSEVVLHGGIVVHHFADVVNELDDVLRAVVGRSRLRFFSPAMSTFPPKMTTRGTTCERSSSVIPLIH